MPARPRRLRCAVYTRKSSEEGLEQAFNSLDAQREACEAYIASQAGEGWQLVRTRYDDGGLSGGTMERPALQRLLVDIAARRVDVVVVYKVDRLTRSLSDIAKIVEVFDAHGVSFVSVTQQFNTTSSMGRLTLNMLLSFAQFEREVTGERIRDKIAASRRRGLWMGGIPPLGYDLEARRLVVNKEEAELVRRIFRRYAQLGCVAKLKAELDREGVRTRRWVSARGRAFGDRAFSRGHLYKILHNRVYLGEAVHKDKAYPGEHKAIVDRETWDRAHRLLAANRQARADGAGATEPSLLRGLLFDDRGNRLSPFHAVKAGRRYRYYVSQATLQGRMQKVGSVVRIPAREIEALVCQQLLALLRNPAAVLDALAPENADGREQHRLLAAARRHLTAWPTFDAATRSRFVRASVCGVILEQEGIKLRLSRRGLQQVLLKEESLAVGTLRSRSDITVSDPEIDSFSIAVAANLKRRGGEMRLIVPGASGLEEPARPNAALIRAVARAHAWKDRLISGQPRSIRALARAEGLPERYVGMLLRLGLLAPDIVEAILNGHQSPDVDLKRLQRNGLLAWAEQRSVFGFGTR